MMSTKFSSKHDYIHNIDVNYALKSLKNHELARKNACDRPQSLMAILERGKSR